ncbi:hypothetical protein ACWDA9_39950, partial [Streptomyces sp. NPDC001193]
MARRRTEPVKQPEAGDDRYAPFADVFTASAAGDDRFPEELIVEHPVAEDPGTQDPVMQDSGVPSPGAAD